MFARRNGRNVGDIIPHAGSTPPRGTLACDGSRVNQSTYARLFAVIGHDYALGGDSLVDGMFRLPGGSGTFFRHGAAPGATGGASTHTHTINGTALTVNQLPAHNHALNMGGDSNTVVVVNTAAAVTTSTAGLGTTGTVQIENAGAGDTHTHTADNGSSLPPYQDINFVIVYR